MKLKAGDRVRAIMTMTDSNMDKTSRFGEVKAVEDSQATVKLDGETDRLHSFPVRTLRRA